jgi:Asp-tRNA(Asn)/Glu-tRNA(Gln) amidotransferase C subunit
MSDSDFAPIEASDISAFEKAARIRLAPERREIVAAAFDGMLPVFDALDGVELGETPPTNSFDPRWRDPA